MKNVIVVKIGGSTFGSRDTTIKDIVSLQKQGKSLVIIHGGGNTVTEWLARQGVATRFVRGERVTDLPTLEVATAVLAGLVNKEIVAAINIGGGQAIGISGIDGAIIQSKMKDKDMGYVGTVEKVNTGPLEALIRAGFIPVLSPLSLHSFDRPDDVPPIINVNADPIAGEVAAALRAEMLIFLTDVTGVSDQSGKVVSRLSAAEAKALIASGVISGGMIPKVNACLKALTVAAITCIIDGRQSGALIKEIEGDGGGTTIYQ